MVFIFLLFYLLSLTPLQSMEAPEDDSVTCLIGIYNFHKEADIEAEGIALVESALQEWLITNQPAKRDSIIDNFIKLLEGACKYKIPPLITLTCVYLTKYYKNNFDTPETAPEKTATQIQETALRLYNELLKLNPQAKHTELFKLTQIKSSNQSNIVTQAFIAEATATQPYLPPRTSQPTITTKPKPVFKDDKQNSIELRSSNETTFYAIVDKSPIPRTDNPTNSFIASDHYLVTCNKNDIKVDNQAQGRRFTLQGHTAPILSVHFITTHKLISRSRDGCIFLWNLNKQTYKVLSNNKDDKLRALAIAQGTMFSLHDNRIIKFWDRSKKSALPVHSEVLPIISDIALFKNCLVAAVATYLKIWPKHDSFYETRDINLKNSCPITKLSASDNLLMAFNEQGKVHIVSAVKKE